MGRFDRFFGDRDVPKIAATRKDEAHPIVGLPPGRWLCEGVYLVECFYPMGVLHGVKPLARPEDMVVMKHFGDGEPVVFLDLETTGLAGGTGTYAFLCGIGMTDGERFKVTQVFLEGPAKEGQWLDAIGDLIPAGACLVTYNGRRFDIPLLRTRHILARTSPGWDGLPHIDLLYHARKLYRGCLDSCSLGSMEKQILGVVRSRTDIPGYLIPSIYVQYLRTRDAECLDGVFYHNGMDILSLVALYNHVASVLEGNSTDGGELARAGDMWYSLGHTERARALWALSSREPSSKFVAHVRIAFCAKKEKDFKTARDEFSLALKTMKEMEGRGIHGERFDVVLILEELAKIEEHRLHMFEEALEHTREALSWLRRNRCLLGGSFARMNCEMLHRANRLVRKARCKTI